MMYLTGDTHGFMDLQKLASGSFPEGKTLTKDDYVVVLGDFGLRWNDDESERWWLDWLEKKPWTTLFVDGNHENFDMLDVLPEVKWNGGWVGVVNESVLHLKRGEVYNLDGKKFFVMGGGMSVDKAYRKEGESWWARELPSEEELNHAWQNLADNQFTVDYVFTHAPPHCMMGPCGAMVDPYGGSNPKLMDPLTFQLQDMCDHMSFDHWYFGHMHVDRSMARGMDDVQFTCLYDKVVKLGETL